MVVASAGGRRALGSQVQILSSRPDDARRNPVLPQVRRVCAVQGQCSLWSFDPQSLGEVGDRVLSVFAAQVAAPLLTQQLLRNARWVRCLYRRKTPACLPVMAVRSRFVRERDRTFAVRLARLRLRPPRWWLGFVISLRVLEKPALLTVGYGLDLCTVGVGQGAPCPSRAKGDSRPA